MPTFKNMDEMFTYMQKAINNTLKEEVATEVKETMHSEIQNTVYSVYEPTDYVRRFEKDGLLDMENMITEPIADGIIAVSNQAPLNTRYGYNNTDKTLTEIICTGEGYMYHNGGAYEQPRDFVEATREDLRQTGGIKEALIKGLKNKGLKIE